MSTIINRGGINVWRDLLYYLTDNQKSNDQNLVADSLHTISMIVDDAQSMFHDSSNDQLLDYLIKPIFGLLSHNQP